MVYSIFILSMLLILSSLNGSDSNNQLIEINNNIAQKPPITACLNYYCCTSLDRCDTTINAKNVKKVGKCFLATSLTTKSIEFSLAACCWPSMSVQDTCRILWFPTCSRQCCSNISYCYGASIDWPCTLMAFTGPLMFLAGFLWEKHKEKKYMNNNDQE